MKFVTFALVLLAQDDQEAPYQPKHKIEFTLAIEERDGAWQFVVEGTTDLPDAVMLRARTYALSEVDDYRGGKRIEEEGLSTDLDRAYHDFSPKNGRFREVAFESRRRPYSLPYRARIFYKPEEQDEAVAKEVGESQEFSFHADARRGTDADLDRELKETLLELTRDLEEIQRLFRDFRAAFIEQQKKFDEEAWNSWSSKWLERVKAVATRNEDRWLLWTVWLERQAQFRIEGFCSHFYQMAEECPRALKGDQEALTGLHRGFDLFTESFDAARDTLGIDTPFDQNAIGGLLASYEEVTRRLGAIVAKGDRATWEQEGEKLRSRGRAALLSLSSQKLLPRRGYGRVVALTQLFLRLFTETERGLPEDGAPLRALLDEHDRALREFRDYAGIK